MASADRHQSSPFAWRHLLRLWLSATVAAHWLRHRSLAEIVRLVADSRPQGVWNHDAGEGAIEAAICSYMRVRPFAFTAHDRCLHDSLTLTQFLAARQLFPQWVIGVKTDPFGAHSWVQSGHTVLNDLHENVRRYRPILVV